jgi:two-component system aerobic respiration control sensor histidine kinase ArcB
MKRIPSHAQEPLTAQCVLDHLLTKMPDHVHFYWKNKAGIYLGCNDAQAKSLGLNNGREVVGKTDFDLPWDKELAKRFWENDLEVLTTGQPKSVEESTLINGEPAVVISLKTPMKDKRGKTSGILGISLDVTAQKRIEKNLIQAKEALEVANEAKQEFLQNMRHDIRTPLSGIVGCAEIIKATAHDPKIKEYAEHLVDSSQALTNLLNEVLELIQVGSQHRPLLKQKFNLAQLIERIISLNQARAAQKNLSLICHYDTNIPPFLIGDSLRLERILLELVTNALNFTQEGKVAVSAKLVRRYHREVILEITVADTGIGIPQEKQSEVFTRFKRLSPAYRGIHPSGAGLGLSIIKQLMDDVDGELYFESMDGKGSTFTCILPLKEALLASHSAHSQLTPKSASGSKAPQRDTSFVILLVEDNAVAAKVATLLLTRLGASVKVAYTGKTAIEEATQKNYDLILLDIGLPDISGIEVAQKIRAFEAEKNRSTPIVALTAHVGKEEEQVYLDAGINEVLSKPLTEAVARKLTMQFWKSHYF